MRERVLFLLAMMTLLVSTATAQESKTKVKYQGEVFVAGDVNFANMVTEGEKVSAQDLLMSGVSLHTIQGIKIGEYVSLGVGLGLDFIIGDADGGDETNVELSGLLIPIYLDCKVWMPTKGRVKPFIMAEGGGSFAIYPQTIAPLYGAGVGFKVGKFSMSLGYMREGFNFRKFIDEDESLEFYQHKLQLRVGVTF